MNNINPIYSINSNYFPAFKQKPEYQDAITNPISSGIEISGLNALSNYNRYTKENITEKLNIPILKPRIIEENIDAIKGTCENNIQTGQTIITDNNGDINKSYVFEQNGSYTYEERDIKNNSQYIQSKNITPEGIYVKIIKEVPQGNRINGVQALYKNGVLEHVSKYEIPSKNSSVGCPYEDIGYDYTSNTYYIEKCDVNNKTIRQNFDSNLNPIKSGR